MSQVGQGFGSFLSKRRTIRAQVNPMDKATIVSIYPKEIDETKPTIQPGRFIIPAGDPDKPAVYTVGPSSWWRDIDDEQPLLEIPVSSIQIADSIVRDYCNGIFGCDMDSSMPGLFYVPGELKLDDIKKSYQAELEKAKKRQNTFFGVLMRAADALWARSNGNPLAISDDMRMAARYLGQEAKDWLKDFQMVDMVRCFACGSLKNPKFPICAACRAIDPTHEMAAKIKFAS